MRIRWSWARVLVVAHAIAFAGCDGCEGSDDPTRHLPPDTAIDQAPAALTNQTHVRIEFHATSAANHFSCQLDDDAPADCTSPFEADVVDGQHTFSVTAALDARVDLTPATTTWKVDTVAPDTTITNGPPAVDNSLAPQVAFTGSDDGGGDLTFECALDGAGFAACTSPATLAVTDGNHTYQVRAIDAAGNADPTPAMIAWLVDSTAPDTMITAGPAEGSTTGASATFAFTSPDLTATFECSLDSAAFTACTSPKAYTLADGPHAFAVRAKDTAGLVDPSPAMRSWTVDTTPPDVMITSRPPNPSNQSTGTFAFTSSDATATFTCKVGAAAFAACSSPWTTAALADGSHTFVVRATDPVGNAATASATWVIDTVAPTVTITSGPAAVTKATTATFTFTTAGAPTAIACSLDGGGFTACTSPTAFTGLADGSHTFVVRATDAAGNSGTAMRTWTVDTVPPVVTVTPVPSPTNDSTPPVMFTVTGATTIQCRVDAGAFAACTSPFTPASLADGSHTVTVRGTDAAGNAATGSTTFVVDTTPPVVTVTPVASPTSDSTPNVVFTVTGATTIECRVDAGAFAACTSPFTPAPLVDGSHTVTVRGTDAAGNSATGSTTFTVDTTAPDLVLDDVPPAQWPVNYFDMKFHTTDATATLRCSLNGAAFTACASPSSIKTAYNVASTFAVRATDGAGNVTTRTTSWTSSDGLVLHYPWEQGKTTNTSLLAQAPPYSPDGTVGVTVVGGWAGAAAGSPAAHTYVGTPRVLSSSAAGTYTASVWLRYGIAPVGTLWSTTGATGGMKLTISGRSIVLAVTDAGGTVTATTAIPPQQWVNVAVRTTGPAKGLALYVNARLITTVMPLAGGTGFDAGQADLTVGGVTDVDLDDLTFYNRAVSDAEMCTLIARGTFDINGTCHVLSPGFELDFENNLTDTGWWNLPVSTIAAPTYVTDTLGHALDMPAASALGYTSGFSAEARAQVGHSFSLWFDAQPTIFDNLIDFTAICGATGVLRCGIFAKYVSANTLKVFAGAANGTQLTATLAVADGYHSLVVAEQRTVDVTTAVQIYIDGVLVKTLPFGAGDVFAGTSDAVALAQTAGTIVDEYEFWPRDLTQDAQMLCENGFDGEWDLATETCLLTAN